MYTYISSLYVNQCFGIILWCSTYILFQITHHCVVMCVTVICMESPVCCDVIYMHAWSLFWCVPELIGGEATQKGSSANKHVKHDSPVCCPRPQPHCSKTLYIRRGPCRSQTRTTPLRLGARSPPKTCSAASLSQGTCGNIPEPPNKSSRVGNKLDQTKAGHYYPSLSDPFLDLVNRIEEPGLSAGTSASHTFRSWPRLVGWVVPHVEIDRLLW